MRKYRTAIIGVGFIGAVHAEALRRLGNIEIAAICDASGGEEKAQELGIDAAYTDYRKMIDEVKPDAVHICTPNNTHYEIAKYAIAKGIHFICEKPFTSTIEQAKELVSLANANKVKGAVNFHNRLYPMTNEMHQMIAGGELGDIFSVHGGYIQDWLLYDTDYTWRLNKSQVGSTRAMADIGSHWMDLAEFVTGSRIVRVNALFKTVHPVRKKPLRDRETFAQIGIDEQYEKIDIDTEDEAVLMVEFDNGAIGSAIISMVFAGIKNKTMLSVAGSRKSVSWNSEMLNDLFLGYREKANEIMTKEGSLMHAASAALASYPSGHVEGFPDAFKNVFKQFYQSLSEEGPFDYAKPEDGLHEMMLCEAAFCSAKSGQWVEVERH